MNVVFRHWFWDNCLYTIWSHKIQQGDKRIPQRFFKRKRKGFVQIKVFTCDLKEPKSVWSVLRWSDRLLLFWGKQPSRKPSPPMVQSRFLRARRSRLSPDPRLLMEVLGNPGGTEDSHTCCGLTVWMQRIIWVTYCLSLWLFIVGRHGECRFTCYNIYLSTSIKHIQSDRQKPSLKLRNIPLCLFRLQ